MKIVYDGQIFGMQEYGGISRYFYELINELGKSKESEALASLVFSNNFYLSKKDTQLQHMKFFPNANFRGKNRIMQKVNKMTAVSCLKKGECDVFHPTYYDPYFIEYLGDTPFVLTVYDMIHEKFVDLFDNNDCTSRNKKILAEKASRIIAISNSTKSDLIDLFHIDEEKISVVYLGNSMQKYLHPVNIKIPEEYILFVGSRNGYKNFNNFLVSTSPILRANKSIFLMCVGGGGFQQAEIDMMLHQGVEKQIVQYNVSDNELAFLYKNAIFFVFPSLYEGFGIPILESFACGCPLVCSNTSSLPEIAENGAMYFNPHDVDSMHNAMMTVFCDRDIRFNLVENGFKILKKYSWSNTALQTETIYHELVK